MARRNVKVDIPRSDADKLIKLTKKVGSNSALVGADCPLKDEPYMATMAADVERAEQLRTEAADLHSKAEAKNSEAAKILGLAPGQTLSTEDTVLYRLTQAKSRLLDRNRGKEENLGPYGFTVKITASTPGKRKVAKP